MSATKLPRRVIQLAPVVGMAIETDGGINLESELYALCDDGTMWYWQDRIRGWRPVVDIPQDVNPGEAPSHG